MALPRIRSYQRTSRYLTMRDGVRIAANVWLPAAARRSRVPAILHQTRYFRAVAWWPPLRLIGMDERTDLAASTRKAFLGAGYAWIDVDVRGSGASFGTQHCPWSRDEIRDGGEVVEWIVRQPWSSGKVGATGISYSGTSAELLLVNRHPAVKAVVPRFSAFDVYADVAFPGGLHLAWFSESWSRFNRALDRNAFHDALAATLRMNGAAFRELAAQERRASLLAALDSDAAEAAIVTLARLAAAGVEPVAGSRALLAAALTEHAHNVDVHERALEMSHRDDTGVVPTMPDASIDCFSPHTHLGEIAASEAPVYSYSGWHDAAYQHAAIKRHLNLPRGRSKLIIGPWEHGGRQNTSPFSPEVRSSFDHDGELLRFFDAHLGHGPRSRLDEVMGGPPVRYFTMGEERWKSADTWPPPGVRPMSWFLCSGGALARGAPEHASCDVYRVDPEAGTGKRSRWRSLVGLLAPLGYGDRADADRRLLCYTSAPLGADMEITGHPLVHLHISLEAPDAAIFAYLEEVDPRGRVSYVTEGMLRVLHRCLDRAPTHLAAVPQRSYRRADAMPLAPGQIAEITFDLLPISYLVRRGHALRLAIAGADRDHFAPVRDASPIIRVHHGAELRSRIELPVAGA